jgi:hypothetical protein
MREILRYAQDDTCKKSPRNAATSLANILRSDQLTISSLKNSRQKKARIRGLF